MSQLGIAQVWLGPWSIALASRQRGGLGNHNVYWQPSKARLRVAESSLSAPLGVRRTACPGSSSPRPAMGCLLSLFSGRRGSKAALKAGTIS